MWLLPDIEVQTQSYTDKEDKIFGHRLVQVLSEGQLLFQDANTQSDPEWLPANDLNEECSAHLLLSNLSNAMIRGDCLQHKQLGLHFNHCKLVSHLDFRI